MRDLERLQLKRYGGAHAWLTISNALDNRALTDREAVDFVAWYFGVPLSPGELRKQYFSGSPSWICYHKSKAKYCREIFSIDAHDHPSRCSKNGKIHDHHVVKDAGNDCLRSMGWIPEWIPEFFFFPEWIPEWKNSTRSEA